MAGNAGMVGVAGKMQLAYLQEIDTRLYCS